MSFNTTERSPPVKSEAENNTPEVPVAALHKNAPATVYVPCIVNSAGLAELSIAEGSASVALPNDAVLRLPVYAVPGMSSVQPPAPVVPWAPNV